MSALIASLLAQPLPPLLASLDDYDARLKSVLQALILLSNLAGGLVIGVAVLRGLSAYAADLVRTRGGEIPKESIRLSLGRSLSLALEFQLAADVLGTALDPTRKDLIILGAIAALRTALNYFLGRELEDAQRRERAAPGTGSTGTLEPTGEHRPPT